MRRRKPKTTAISIYHLMTFSPDFKWGTVDAYQEKMRSFAYVQRAFQPVLVSLEHEKRRWLPGENFSGRVWVVNDLTRAFSDCTVELTVTDASGHQQWKELRPIDRIVPSSSAEVAPLPWNWTVAGQVGQTFRVSFNLRDTAGNELSHNFYDLLCADQEAARTECARRADVMEASRDAFGYHNYFRYYPALSRGPRPNQTGDIPVPAQEYF